VVAYHNPTRAVTSLAYCEVVDSDTVAAPLVAVKVTKALGEHGMFTYHGGQHFTGGRLEVAANDTYLPTAELAEWAEQQGLMRKAAAAHAKALRGYGFRGYSSGGEVTLMLTTEQAEALIDVLGIEVEA
jgi:hypothetical protein